MKTNNQTITSEILLYGKKQGQIEDLLSTKPEDFLFIIPLAKRQGFGNFRIVDYTLAGFEKPNFVKTINQKK